MPQIGVKRRTWNDVRLYCYTNMKFVYNKLECVLKLKWKEGVYNSTGKCENHLKNDKPTSIVLLLPIATQVLTRKL